MYERKLNHWHMAQKGPVLACIATACYNIKELPCMHGHQPKKYNKCTMHAHNYHNYVYNNYILSFGLG